MTSEGQENEAPRQSVTEEMLLATRWMQLSKDGTCTKLAQALMSLALAAHSEGCSVEADALKFLGSLCGMGLDTDSGGGPFQPFMTIGDKRSLIPSDLSTDEISAIASFCTHPELPAALRARLSDVVWVRARPRSSSHGRIAIDSYREYPPDPKSWFHGGRQHWTRAIQLCREIGKDCAGRLAEIESVLVNRLLATGASSSGFLAGVADVLASNGLGAAERIRISEHLQTVADDCGSASDWATARELYGEAGRWLKRGDDDAILASVVFRRAEMWAQEAAFFEQSHGSGYMMAPSAYDQAIQLLRSIPSKQRKALEVDARVVELRHRLNESHERALQAMEPFFGEAVDLSALAVSAQEAVTGKGVLEALETYVTFFSVCKGTGYRILNGTAKRIG